MKYRNQTIKRLPDDRRTGRQRWALNGEPARRVMVRGRMVGEYWTSRESVMAAADNAADETLARADDLGLALPADMLANLRGE